MLQVRVEIVPKYYKGKKIRSKMKTRPLENAGTEPVWNEYMKLDYWPPEGADDASPVIPPMVKVSVWDIEMPGEAKGAKIIGIGEIPLSAFVSNATDHPVPMTKALKLYTEEDTPRASGSLLVGGLFEVSNQDETQQSAFKEAVKTFRSANAASGEVDGFCLDATPNTISGRIELHVRELVYGEGMKHEDSDSSFLLHAWLSLAMSNRHQAPTKVSSPDGNPSWDHKFTLYTDDIETDTLRVDITKRYVKVVMNCIELILVITVKNSLEPSIFRWLRTSKLPGN